MEAMEAKAAAKGAMETKAAAKEAAIVSLFRIDDPCVLIWFSWPLIASYGKTGGEEYNSPHHSQQGSGYGGPQCTPIGYTNRPAEC
jgi:hypothetical protein